MKQIFDAHSAAITTHRSCAHCSVSKTALNALTVHWADMLTDTKVKVLLPHSMPIFYPTSKTRLPVSMGNPYAPPAPLAFPSLASNIRLSLKQYHSSFTLQRAQVNAVDPGHCATDINNHSGPRSSVQGAMQPIKMALIGPDGPTATYTNDDGRVEW